MTSNSQSFNPNSNVYRSCCCHTKTFTIVSGILEIFTICFILVAILPDVNSRLCDEGRNRMSNFSGLMSSTQEPIAVTANVSEKYKITMELIRRGVCDLNLIWLLWAVAQIISVNLMFYGMKSVRWVLFMPHVFFRLASVGLFCFGCFTLIYTISEGGGGKGYIAALAFNITFVIFWLYLLYAEARCVHFVKRSQETGVSMTVARAITQNTISLSDREPTPHTVPRSLPPLRHEPARKYEKT